MSACTQHELVVSLARRCRLRHSQAQAVVAALLAELARSLADGSRVEVRGLGSFVPCKPRRRRIRQVATGDLVEVEAGPTVRFRPGQAIRQRLAAQAPAAGEVHSPACGPLG